MLESPPLLKNEGMPEGGPWKRIMNGITEIADSLSTELKRRLPNQRKTQRTKLALLVATMLDVRSANLMELAAGLPRECDRTDMRYQWISRLLGNPLVISDAIMEPFSREVLERATALASISSEARPRVAAVAG